MYSHSSFWCSHIGSAFLLMNSSVSIPSIVSGRLTRTCLPFMKTHMYFFCLSAFASFLARFCAAVSFRFTFAISVNYLWANGASAERGTSVGWKRYVSNIKSQRSYPERRILRHKRTFSKAMRSSNKTREKMIRSILWMVSIRSITRKRVTVG